MRMLDAIREAVEYLHLWDRGAYAQADGIRILRSLLAALTAEGEGKTCPGCGGLGWIPAGDEQLGCIDCNGTGEAPAPQPAPTTVPPRGAALRYTSRPNYLRSLATRIETAISRPLPPEVEAAVNAAVDTVVAKYERAIARSPFEKGRLRTAREVSNECAAAVKKALSVARGAKGGGVRC